MLTLDEYAPRFTKIALSRTDDGVLTARLHTDDGPLVYDATAHAELAAVFRFVADDVANRVVVLTGTGDAFWSRLNPPSFAHLQQTPAGWDQTYFEERRTLEGFLGIDVPVIAAVNGPALVHSHLPLLADIVIADSNAVFGDALHAPGGIVPGDGAQLVWPMLLGMNRGRHFLLTGQTLDAPAALAAGIVAEVTEPDRLQQRAAEIAADLASKPTLMLRQTRAVLRHELERTLVRDLSRGMMHEAVAALDLLSEHLQDKPMVPRPESEHFLFDAHTGETGPLPGR